MLIAFNQLHIYEHWVPDLRGSMVRILRADDSYDEIVTFISSDRQSTMIGALKELSNVKDSMYLRKHINELSSSTFISDFPKRTYMVLSLEPTEDGLRYNVEFYQQSSLIKLKTTVDLLTLSVKTEQMAQILDKNLKMAKLIER